MSDKPLCIACGKWEPQLHYPCSPGAVLCGFCSEIYLFTDTDGTIKQKKAIALALAGAGYTLSHRFEVMLTARDREEIIEKRMKERIERRNAELAAIDGQLNGAVDYLFEPRE